MPLSRTVNGLLYEFSLDSLDQVGYYPLSGPPVWSVDTVDKKEGVGCLKAYGEFTSASYIVLVSTVPLAVAGCRVHIWHKATTSSQTWYLKMNCTGQAGCVYGQIPYYTTTIISKAGSEAWTLKSADIPAGVAVGSNAILYPSVFSAAQYANIEDRVDRLVISTSRYLTITGLHFGQLVRIYRASDDVKIAEATCTPPNKFLVFNIDAEDYPEYVYLKVYATDGATLVEITPMYRVSGGDTWNWVPPFGTLTITSSAYRLYRTGSGGSPQEADLTITLKTAAGAPYPNATIYVSTTRGTTTWSWK
jgi:hypothetical protein